MEELNDVHKLEFINELDKDDEFVLVSKSKEKMVRTKYSTLSGFLAKKSTVNIRGDRGDTGIKGEIGDRGVTGSIGGTGATGQKGEKSNETGEIGVAGQQGDQGVTGARGEKSTIYKRGAHWRRR